MFERLWWNWRHRDLRKSIDRHGWSAIYVGDYHSAPSWAYTMGFRSSLGAPEVIVFDVPADGAHGVFHEAYRQLASGELMLRDGEPWPPGETEHPMVWRRVHPSRFDDEEPWLGLAQTVATIFSPQLGPFEAYQLVLSDPHGHLPWESSYDERLRERQPALWEPTISPDAGPAHTPIPP